MVAFDSNGITFIRDGLKNRVSKNRAVKTIFKEEADRAPLTARKSIPYINYLSIDSNPVQEKNSAGEKTPKSVKDFIFKDDHTPLKMKANHPQIGNTNTAGTSKNSAETRKIFAYQGLAEIHSSAKSLRGEDVGKARSVSSLWLASERTTSLLREDRKGLTAPDTPITSRGVVTHSASKRVASELETTLDRDERSSRRA